MVAGLCHDATSLVGSLVSFGGRVAAAHIFIALEQQRGWRWGARGLYSTAYNLHILPVLQLNALTTLSFAAVYLLSALVKPIREEIHAIRELTRESSLSKYSLSLSPRY